MRTTLLLPLVMSFLAAGASAQNLTVSRVGGDGSAFRYWGEDGGMHAYSFSTTACNVGTTNIAWFPDGSSNHPVIG